MQQVIKLLLKDQIDLQSLGNKEFFKLRKARTEQESEAGEVVIRCKIARSEESRRLCQYSGNG